MQTLQPFEMFLGGGGKQTAGHAPFNGLFVPLSVICARPCPQLTGITALFARSAGNVSRTGAIPS